MDSDKMIEFIKNLILQNVALPQDFYNYLILPKRYLKYILTLKRLNQILGLLRQVFIWNGLKCQSSLQLMAIKTF